MTTAPALSNPPGPSPCKAAPAAALAAQAPREGLALTPTGLLIIALLGAAFAGLFYHFFYVQNFQAMTNEDWSHSYFVPLITLYLLWHKRAELAALRPVVFWPGVILVVLGIMCYALFQLNQALNNHMLRGFSMLVTLFGLILLLLGPRVAQVMFLPIAYLVFGVTLAERIMDKVTVPLRYMAADGSFFLLDLFGAPVTKRGTVLEVMTSTGPKPLDVAQACSGMRMVIAFVALGVAVALLSSRHWWQRIALILMAVPIAVMMNVARVATLALLTLYDPKLADGESHMMVGYLLLIPAFLLYMGIAWALGKVIVEPREKKPAPTRWWRPGPINWQALRAPAVLASLAIIATSALALPTVVRVAGVHLRKLPIYAEGTPHLRSIPAETASWERIGDDFIDSNDVLKELGTENTVTRAYRRKRLADGEHQVPLQLHLAYYTGGVDAVPHIQERCMVAGGWEIAPGGTTVLPLALDQKEWRPHELKEGRDAGIMQSKLSNKGAEKSGGRHVAFSAAPGSLVTLPRDADKIGLRITEFADAKRGRRLFGGYFFLANGGTSDSAEGVRLLAFSLQDDYAYYCKVQVSSETARSAEELASQASSLLSELLPEIVRCVPDWVEVRRGAYPPGRAATPSAK